MLSTARMAACRLIAALGCGDRTGYRVGVSPGPDASMATLGDDLVLLSVSQGDGQVRSASVLGIGLMGAELVRLAASGRVVIPNGRVVVIDPTPTGDAEADAALASLAAARRSPRARSWCSRPRRGICDAYLARLQAAGLIRSEQRTVLRFIPVTRWRITDPARVTDARARLDAIATGTGQIDLAQAAFGGLAHAIGLSGELYPGRENRALRKRLQQVADGDLTGPPDLSAAHHAVSSSVHAASHAAVSAAVHSATHAAVSAAHSAESGGHGGGGGHH
jgi:Golgi phosphoprotein 3 (GPP34)